ncbi:MAG: hypothetical protein RLY93_11720 [Sumerlaeia bacterium]
MKKIIALLCSLAAVVALTGCSLPSKVDLTEVASRTGVQNATTGDGTYENYNATGIHKSTEIGIGVGLPMLVKFIELYPALSPEDLLVDAAANPGRGTDGLILIEHREGYYGFPFGIVGIYVDRAEATAIASK